MTDEPVPVSAEVFAYGTSLAEAVAELRQVRAEVDGLRRELLTIARLLRERERGQR